MKQKATTIRTLTFHQVLQLVSSIEIKGALYNDSLFIVSEREPVGIDRVMNLFRQPIRVGLYVLVLCSSGKMEFSCNLKRYTLTANSLFICPRDAVMQVHGPVLQGKVSILFADYRFMEILNPNIQKILPYIDSFKDNLCIPISEQTLSSMKEQFHVTESVVLTRQGNTFYDELVRSLILSITYSTLAVISEKAKEQDSPSASTRQQQHFKRFSQLLQLNYRKERSTKFYAEQMSLTPKYLSTVIMEITGRKASEWINECVMIEAKRLLKSTDLTIQEISLQLNFPNQSFFGRYFKQHSGMSPNEFRKS